MTCKECYHFGVCHRRINRIDFLPIIDGKISEFPKMYIECFDVENYCRDFKDKSKILELPCKVGDTVYDITLAGFTKKEPDKIKVFSITMLNTDKRLHFCFHCHKSNKTTINFELQDIGKYIFLTREEAEKALEGVKK